MCVVLAVLVFFWGYKFTYYAYCAGLPGKTLERRTLRIDAQRNATGLQLLRNELVHFLCAD